MKNMTEHNNIVLKYALILANLSKYIVIRFFDITYE